MFAPVFVLAGGAPVILAQTVINYPLRPLFFTVLLPFVILLIARAVATAGRPATRGVSGAAIAATAAGLILLVAVERRHPDDFRGLAEIVERRTTNERAIVVAPDFHATPIERYYRGPLEIRRIPRADMPVALARLREGTDPVWLIVDQGTRPVALADATEVPTGWWMRLFRVSSLP